MNHQIIPIIMTDSMTEFEQKLDQVKHLAVDRVAIDVIDGIFADNILVGLDDLREMEFSDLAVDIQLMVEEPTDYLGQVSSLPAKQKRVYGHIEKMGRRDEYIGVIKELELELGWALDLHTPIEELTKEELLRSEGILLMSVPAGFSGQTFAPSVLKKIAYLRQLGYQGDICVDGGLNEQTIKQCLEVGANHFDVNSALWKAEDVEKQLHIFNQLLPI